MSASRCVSNLMCGVIKQKQKSSGGGAILDHAYFLKLIEEDKEHIDTPMTIDELNTDPLPVVYPWLTQHQTPQQPLSYLTALCRKDDEDGMKVQDETVVRDVRNEKPIDRYTKEARKRQDMRMFQEDVAGEYNSDWTNNLYICNPDPNATPRQIAETFEAMFECKVRSVDFIDRKLGSNDSTRLQRKYNIAYSPEIIGDSASTNPATYVPLMRTNAFVNMLYWEINRMPASMYGRLLAGGTLFVPYRDANLVDAPPMRVKMARRIMKDAK